MYKFHVAIDAIHSQSTLVFNVMLSNHCRRYISVKPSPEGEGWVRGNQHREKT